jgi:hypothetical protein
MGYLHQNHSVVAYQAWLPAATLPTLPVHSAPNAGAGAGPLTDVNAPKAFNAVLDAWWHITNPMPTIPAFDALNTGLGPTFTVFHSAQVVNNAILASWIPPDPLPTIPVQFGKRFTAPAPPGPTPSPSSAATPPHGVAPNGAVPVYLTTNGSVNGAVPRAGAANTVTQGGQAVVAIVGPVNGGFIYNPPDATAQNIMTAENINVDMTTPPLAGDASGYGTTSVIATGQTFTVPSPLAPGVQVWINAATSGHRFTCVVW